MTATPDRPATTPEGAGLAEALVRALLDCRLKQYWENPCGAAVVTIGEVEIALDGKCPCGCTPEMHIGEIGCPCGFPDDDDLPCIPDIAHLSERTEGAGEVALSEERAVCACGEYDFIHVEADHGRALLTAGRETAIRAVHDLEATSADPSVEEYVDAVLAALPTAGRVVEVERVAEQVEALADEWVAQARDLDARAARTQRAESKARLRDRALPIHHCADDLRALAAAIRADGSAES